MYFTPFQVKFSNKRLAFLTTSVGTFGSTMESLACSGAGLYSSNPSTGIEASLTIPCGVTGQPASNLSSSTRTIVFGICWHVHSAGSGWSMRGNVAQATIVTSKSNHSDINITHPHPVPTGHSSEVVLPYTMNSCSSLFSWTQSARDYYFDAFLCASAKEAAIMA